MDESAPVPITALLRRWNAGDNAAGDALLAAKSRLDEILTLPEK